MHEQNISDQNKPAHFILCYIFLYIQPGDSYTDAECQTKWTCDGSGTARPDHIGGCEEGASCVPGQKGGAYECECDDGFARNGDNCERITHCTVTVDGVEITLQV